MLGSYETSKACPFADIWKEKECKYSLLKDQKLIEGSLKIRIAVKDAWSCQYYTYMEKGRKAIDLLSGKPLC